MNKWFDDTENMNNIVISSRVRLARNLYNYPFSLKINDEQTKRLVNDVKESFFGQSEQVKHDYDFYEVNQLDRIDKLYFVETHSVSPLLIKKDHSTGVILSKDASTSIMINEEDHLRIQAVSAGENMGKVFKEANRIDDLFSERLIYAFNQKYGYITSCPTNLGTGLRASYMVHLPFLESEELIKSLSDEMNRFGFTIRGIYGEGTQALGSIYQISNQKTLGQSEEEIISSLNNIVQQVIKQEKILRENSKKKNPLGMEDMVFKAYGILKHARCLTSQDAMTYLSRIRIGLCEGLMNPKDENKFNIYHLMIQIQPANLQKAFGKIMTSDERDKFRAELIRLELPEMI